MNEDKVNHPNHYTSHPSGVECIDIARHYCFDIGNAIVPQVMYEIFRAIEK